MSGVGTCCAVILAGILTAAAIAKLRTPAATASTFRRLGLPAPAALARAVPVTEVVAGLLLLARPYLGGLLALVLLSGFTAVVVRSVRAGLEVPCGCFGATGTQPLSWVDAVRNGLLALLALPTLAVAAAPVRPALEDVVLATTGVALGLVVLALCHMKRSVGAVWDNTLAGEVGTVTRS